MRGARCDGIGRGQGREGPGCSSRVRLGAWAATLGFTVGFLEVESDRDVGALPKGAKGVCSVDKSLTPTCRIIAQVFFSKRMHGTQIILRHLWFDWCGAGRVESFPA